MSTRLPFVDHRDLMNILVRFAILAVLVVAAAPAKGRKGRQPTSQHVVAANTSSIALIAPTRSGGGANLEERINTIYAELVNEDDYLDMMIAKQAEHVSRVVDALTRINTNLANNPDQFGARTATDAQVNPVSYDRPLTDMDPDTTELQSRTTQLATDIEAKKHEMSTRQQDMSVMKINIIDTHVESATAQMIDVTLADVGNKPSGTQTAPGNNLHERFDNTATKYEAVKAKFTTWYNQAVEHATAAEANIAQVNLWLNMD